jgi:hypothetical protein
MYQQVIEMFRGLIDFWELEENLRILRINYNGLTEKIRGIKRKWITWNCKAWKEAKNQRNFMAHNYPGPDRSQLWETAWASLKNVVQPLGSEVKDFLKDDNLLPSLVSLQSTKSVRENFC